MSIYPAPNPSFARSSTAIPISARSSARPAPNTCCPIASVFPPRCPRILAHAGRQRLLDAEAQCGLAARPLIGGPDSPEKTPEGIPFNVGIWKGPDGRTILAALNPGGYGSTIDTDLSKTPPPPPSPPPGSPPRRSRTPEHDWVSRIEHRRQGHRRLRRLPLHRHRRHRRRHR